MFSYRKSLPTPPAFDPNAFGPVSFGDRNTSAAGDPLHPVDGQPISGQPTSGIRKAYNQEITALLLDDTPLTRECLSISLNLCDRGLHVLTAASVADVEAMIGGDTAPNVVLCHFSVAPSDPQFLGKLNGLIAILGRIPLIVLADREDPSSALDAFRLGARGYIPTTVGLSVALEAIRLVGAGGTFIPTSFLQRMMQEQAPAPASPPIETERTNGDDDRLSGLTPRQLAVLKCLREGKANKIIAYELGMQESTVKVHVRNILKKLGATNRTQAVYLTFNEQPLN